MSIDAGTLVDLEQSLTAEFNSIFEGKTYYNSLGHAVPLRAYTHSLPVKQGSDDEPTDADVPEPYIVSEIQNGKKDTEDDGHEVNVAVIICVCDDNTARHGHQDILAIIGRVLERFGKRPDLAGKFNLRHPLEWTLSDEDTYPYYYGGLLLHFEVPAIEKEDALA